jgi:hypothetical protein
MIAGGLKEEVRGRRGATWARMGCDGGDVLQLSQRESTEACMMRCRRLKLVMDDDEGVLYRLW